MTQDIMIKRRSFSRPFSFPSLPWWFACLAAATAFLAIANSAFAQKRYNTPDDAVTALIDAARAGSSEQLMQVLGPGSEEIVLSGDPVADAATRTQVLDAYNAQHQIMLEHQDLAVLVIGQENVPFPIPLVRQNNTWRFDAQAGRREIVRRRTGRNELSAIQSSAGKGVYAQRFVSRSGEKDGLYWPVLSDEDESPLGEFAAARAAQGYPVGPQRSPYRGYYYRILIRQGPNAPGGQIDYVVGGKMVGGFALVAYPAHYGNSGVMTFLVNHEGNIYEKDLGWRTAAIASGITSFDPDNTWRRVTAAVPPESGPR